MEAQEAMTRGESSGECWETIGAEDRKIKCDDVEDHRIKEELTVQNMNNESDEKIRIQGQAPKGHTAKVDKVHDFNCSTNRWQRTSGAELEFCSMLFVLPFFVREACAKFKNLYTLNVIS